MRGSCILLILHTASCILLHIPTSTRTRLPTCKSSALPEGVDGERGKGFMQDAAMAEEAWFVSARTRVSWSAKARIQRGRWERLKWRRRHVSLHELECQTRDCRCSLTYASSRDTTVRERVRKVSITRTARHSCLHQTQQNMPRAGREWGKEGSTILVSAGRGLAVEEDPLADGA